MFQCSTCGKDSNALIQGECYNCIRLNPEKEANLRQHFSRYDEGGPLPNHETFFEWLTAPADKETNE